MPKKPWERFKATDYDPKSGWNDTCAELGYLYHVAHIDTAYRIMNDGICRAGLIFDKSRLNKQRILVNRLSPNIWHNGSRYGKYGRVIVNMLQVFSNKIGTKNIDCFLGHFRVLDVENYPRLVSC